MSVLRNIEHKIEGLFEGVFGRAFRTHVQPVELARKLVKEMERIATERGATHVLWMTHASNNLYLTFANHGYDMADISMMKRLT